MTVASPTLALLPILEPLAPAQKLFLFDIFSDRDRPFRGHDQKAIPGRSRTHRRLDGAQRSVSSDVKVSKLSLPSFAEIDEEGRRYGSLDVVHRECEVLLSALVYAGEEVGMSAMYTFQRGAAHLQLDDAELLIPDVCGLDQVEEALRRVSEVAPSAQRKLSLACGACVTSDREVTEDEAFMLREIYAELRFPQSQRPARPTRRAGGLIRTATPEGRGSRHFIPSCSRISVPSALSLLKDERHIGPILTTTACIGHGDRQLATRNRQTCIGRRFASS